MSARPPGPRLAGIHLSDAVSILAKHYGGTREDGKRAIMFGALETVVHTGGQQPDFVLVGRDIAAPANSEPLAFDHDWLREAELVYRFADNLLVDQAGQARITEVRIWDRNSWDARHRKGRRSFREQDATLIRNAERLFKEGAASSVMQAIKLSVARGAHLPGDGLEDSHYKRIERRREYKDAVARCS